MKYHTHSSLSHLNTRHLCATSSRESSEKNRTFYFPSPALSLSLSLHATLDIRLDAHERYSRGEMSLRYLKSLLFLMDVFSSPSLSLFQQIKWKSTEKSQSIMRKVCVMLQETFLTHGIIQRDWCLASFHTKAQLAPSASSHVE